MRSLIWIVIVSFCLVLSGCVDGQEGPDANAQLLADIETIDTYLTSNNITAYQDKSGIRFHIEELGTGGFPPRTDQTISIQYQGKFLDGNIFDPGGDASGVMNTFITGFQLGLIVWPEGTKGTIYVPSPLGYGDQEVGSIPPNSILVFDVWLKDVVLTNTEKARFTADTVAIDEYLADESINAVKDTTGLRYVITEPGTGSTPTWYTKVRFNYTGKLLSSGTEFFSGVAQPSDIFDSRVVDYLHGIKVALTKVGVGGKITAYVPSGLAFGTSSQGSIPSNSNVIYEIELVEIIP